MDGTARLAKMFKDRENRTYLGPQIGIVISPPPEVQIGLGDRIMLAKEQLVFAAHLLTDYHRDMEILPTSNLSGNTSMSGDHTHSYASLGMVGTIKLADTIEAGDEVILIPSADEQLYFVVDKAVRL